jgi:DNA-directed RNA polymerase specialized sigma24 family protein
MEEVAISRDTHKVIEHADVLDRLYRTEYIGMVRLAYTLVGTNAEAEDVVQDSFVEVARRLDEIRKPGAYLRTAVVSRCRSLLRRRRVMALHPPEPPAGLASDAGELWDVLGRCLRTSASWWSSSTTGETGRRRSHRSSTCRVRPSGRIFAGG